MATKNLVLIWTKSIAPHAEDDAVGDCRELIQSHMTQKPELRGEVDARALRV